LASRGSFTLEVPGHTFRFQLHQYAGPYVLSTRGRPLADQPGPRSLFWEAYWQWDRQGRRVDDQGRCIFKWETALVQITKQVNTPATRATRHVRLKPATKVTIRSIPRHADIFSDGRFLGNAPAMLTLPVGKYQFRLVLNGHKDWIRELELIPESDLTLVAKLVKLSKQNGSQQGQG